MEMAAGDPARSGLVRIVVSGASMEPTLRHGDVILVSPAVPAVLRPGEVITFLTDAGPVTHRIVDRSGDDLITKGDNARAFDPPVNPGRIVGRVDAVVRAGIETPLPWGVRAVRVARLSMLEGRLAARIRPQRRAPGWVKLAGFPLRLLIAIVASPRLSR